MLRAIVRSPATTSQPALALPGSRAMLWVISTLGRAAIVVITKKGRKLRDSRVSDRLNTCPMRNSRSAVGAAADTFVMDAPRSACREAAAGRAAIPIAGHQSRHRHEAT